MYMSQEKIDQASTPDDLNKEMQEREKLIAEIMAEDEASGLYDIDINKEKKAYENYQKLINILDRRFKELKAGKAKGRNRKSKSVTKRKR